MQGYVTYPMEAALEASFYVLAGILSLGLLMVLVLFKDIFFHGRFTTVLPALQRVPNTALDAARVVFQALKAAYAKANGPLQEEIGHEIRHMENRIAQLEDKAFVDQSDYYDALKARERVWREWRSLHEEARLGGRSRRRSLRPQLEDLKKRYAKIDREVREEYQRAVARDVLTLEELKRQGVLEPEVLYPRQEPASPTPDPEAQPGGEESRGEAGEGAPTGEVAAKDKPADPSQANAAEGEGTPKPAHAPRRWKTPLAPYPPAQSGELRQIDLNRTEMQKSQRTYVDETMRVDILPQRMLQRVNFNLSSFAEVVWLGVHRYAFCTFIGTDMRRLQLPQAEGVHLFQDCDFQGASLAQSRITQAIFRRCNLTNTHWRGARLDRVKFESCITTDIHWEGVDLSRTIVSEDMVERTSFSGAVKLPRNFAVDEAEPGAVPAPKTAPSPQPGTIQTAPSPQPGTVQTGDSSQTKVPRAPQPAEVATEETHPQAQPPKGAAGSLPEAQPGQNPRPPRQPVE